MQKLITKMSSSGIQEIGVSETLKHLFKEINKVFINRKDWSPFFP